MKIIATGDLHYGKYPRYDEQTRRMAETVCRECGDVLVLAGDIGSGGAASFAECLELFTSFRGAKMMVPGNHDLWTKEGDSHELYDAVLPRLAAENGFIYLDKGPAHIDSVAFVGTIGWYDYTLRDPRLDIDESYYAAKTYPGKVRWNDGRFVRWGFTDAEFTDRCIERLISHLGMVRGRAKKVVCVTHHIPFENMVDRKKIKVLAFCNAFLGSSRMGEALLRHENITHLLCAHSHNRGEFRNGPIICLKIGSSYREKTFTAIEV